jgi:acyl-CoA hydrolase
MDSLKDPRIADLGAKLLDAKQALAMIRPGSRIYLGTGCAAPRSLIAGMESMASGPPDLEFVSFLTTSALLDEGNTSGSQYRHRTFFVGSDVRGLAASGRLDYVPICLEEVPDLLASGRLPIDVAASSQSTRCARLCQPRSVGRPCAGRS